MSLIHRASRIGYCVSRRLFTTTTSRNIIAGNNTKSGSGSATTAENDRIEHDERLVESQILSAALNYVNTKGWTLEAIEAGAEEVYMSGEISSIFDEYDLVKYFIASSNQDLEKHLSSNQLNLQQALEYRLQKVVPYAQRFNEALAFTTRPENIPQSMQLLMNLSDSIAHHAMKDTSADLTWYTKRLGVASIYVSSELCLVQDKSANFTDTFKFLERRVKDFEAMRKGTSTLSSIPLPDVLSAGFATMMNILGRNVPR